MMARYVVFSDLDGTLLDPASYSHEAAEPALEALRRQQVPLVMCTSKTRAEVEHIRARLGNRDPFIVENGAAIFIPRGYFPFASVAEQANGSYERIELGMPYREIVIALRRASHASGCEVRGFDELSAAELAQLCGMSLQEAELAKRREYDEPFEILTENLSLVSSLLDLLDAEGLTWTRGGRFYHARGRHNKGQAAEILIDLFRRRHPAILTAGLGDGPNDISLLETVDVPIVTAGPQNWNQAILRLLGSPSFATSAQ